MFPPQRDKLPSFELILPKCIPIQIDSLELRPYYVMHHERTRRQDLQRWRRFQYESNLKNILKKDDVSCGF